MPKRPYKPLTDQLRRAINDSGMSRYAIARETGVSETALSLFVNGHRGLSGKAMDAVGEFLGLRIVVDKPKQRKGT